MSKGELSAFLESQTIATQPAADQVVRNLLQGMVKNIDRSPRDKLRLKSDSPSTSGTKSSYLIKALAKEAAGKNTNTMCQ